MRTRLRTRVHNRLKGYDTYWFGGLLLLALLALVMWFMDFIYWLIGKPRGGSVAGS